MEQEIKNVLIMSKRAVLSDIAVEIARVQDEGLLLNDEEMLKILKELYERYQ